MGSKSTCDFCGMEIPSADFEEGRAVVVFKKRYCRKCLDRAVRQRTKSPKQSGRHTPGLSP